MCRGCNSCQPEKWFSEGHPRSLEHRPMKVMAVTGYGAPLEMVEVPEHRLIPGHALIEVLTCGVCFSDLKTARGNMPFSEDLNLPHIPGHEICGRVLDTDPPGAVEPGTRVVVY